MEKYDIIILGGQSNAEGAGLGEVENIYQPNDKILCMDAEKTVEVAPEAMRVTFLDKPFSIQVANERLGENGQRVGSFALIFAREYMASGLLEEGRKLLIVRVAVGGTGFKKGHWGVNAPLYYKLREMTDYALSLNTENKVVAFLWHQGEHDAFEGNPPENYKKQLLELLSDVRARYKGVPFIAGDFVNEWKSLNIESCAPIVDVIKDVVAEIGNSAFVEAADLPSNNETRKDGDNIHFCKQSAYALGERYFDAYRRIIGK